MKITDEAVEAALSDDECTTCVGTGLVEDAATSLSLGKGGFKPCPDCAPTDTQEGKELGYDAHGNLTTFDARDDDTSALTATLARQKEAGKWAEKYGAELGRNVVAEARILELEADLEVATDKVVRLRDLLDRTIPETMEYDAESGGFYDTELTHDIRAALGGQSNG